MRLALILVLALFAVVQWQLWFGKGGWLRVWQLQAQLEAQRSANASALASNAALAAEIDSLRAGGEAIEERARYQLNMIRGDETFFQRPPQAQ